RTWRYGSRPLSRHEPLPIFEEGADITAGSLTVEARHDLLSFSVAGAVTSAENTGIGVGVAVQRAETSTLDGHAHADAGVFRRRQDRKSTRLNSSHVKNSYAV